MILGELCDLSEPHSLSYEMEIVAIVTLPCYGEHEFIYMKHLEQHLAYVVY